MNFKNRKINACIYYENIEIIMIIEETGHISTYKRVSLDSKKIRKFSDNFKVEIKIFHSSGYKIKVFTIWKNNEEYCKIYFVPILR